MEKDILGRVIEVEREIQERIHAEKIKAEEWVKKIRFEVRKKVTEEEEKIKEEYRKAVDNAVADYKNKASDIIADAMAQAEKMSKLSDETLRKILLRHIRRILPAEYAQDKTQGTGA